MDDGYVCVCLCACVYLHQKEETAGLGTYVQGFVICLWVCVWEKNEWVRTFRQSPPLPPRLAVSRHAANCIVNTCTESVPWWEEEQKPQMSICFPPSLPKQTYNWKKKLLKIKRHIEFYLIRINTMIPNIPYTWHSQSLKFQYKKIMITFAGKSLRRHFID